MSCSPHFFLLNYFSSLCTNQTKCMDEMNRVLGDHAGLGQEGSVPAKKVVGAQVIVDGFFYQRVGWCKAWLLSHFHSDHYGGLNARWAAGPIICNQATAEAVASELRVERRHLVVFPMNQRTLIGGTDIAVTLLDANHCPGACMFLFELGASSPSPRRVLHTGDFRYHPAMKRCPLLSSIQPGELGTLYLDATYGDPAYTFYPQQVALHRVECTVRSEYQSSGVLPSELLFLIGAYKLVFLSLS